MKTSESHKLLGRDTYVLPEHAQELPLAEAGYCCHLCRGDVALGCIAGRYHLPKPQVVHILVVRQMSEQERIYQSGYLRGFGC